MERLLPLVLFNQPAAVVCAMMAVAGAVLILGREQLMALETFLQLHHHKATAVALASQVVNAVAVVAVEPAVVDLPVLRLIMVVPVAAVQLIQSLEPAPITLAAAQVAQQIRKHQSPAALAVAAVRHQRTATQVQPIQAAVVQAGTVALMYLVDLTPFTTAAQAALAL